MQVYLFKQLIPFHQSWQWQHDLVAQRKSDSTLGGVLLLLEHPPVYTIGQGSSLEHFKQPIDYVPIERGGEVTYHGPGQLVGYAILNLHHYRKDLHWYLRQLEEVLLRTLSRLEIKAVRIPGLTGVWVDHKKVGQIGIKVSRWITMHGFSLNISMDKSGFDPIVPCGIKDCQCANLNDFRSQAVEVSEVQSIVAEIFAEVFTIPEQFHS